MATHNNAIQDHDNDDTIDISTSLIIRVAEYLPGLQQTASGWRCNLININIVIGGIQIITDLSGSIILIIELNHDQVMKCDASAAPPYKRVL